MQNKVINKINKFTRTIMKNNVLALSIADIINKAVREKRGRLTEVSDLSVINRQSFDADGIAQLPLFQFVRLGQALAVSLPKDRYEQMKSNISETFWDSIEGKEAGNGND